MSIRNSVSVVALFALALPLAALADAPSGDFDQLFPRSSASTPKASAAERAENSKSVEVSVSDLIRREPAKTIVTREEVRKELAAKPMPHVEA